jgi:hypothetical protein
MDRYEVAVLAEDAASKRQTVEMLGMLNTFDLDAAERLKQDVQYRIAQAEWMEEETALTRALNRPPREP